MEYTPIVEEPGSEISNMSGNDLKKTDKSGVEELDMAVQDVILYIQIVSWIHLTSHFIHQNL